MGSVKATHSLWNGQKSLRLQLLPQPLKGQFWQNEAFEVESEVLWTPANWLPNHMSRETHLLLLKCLELYFPLSSLTENSEFSPSLKCICWPTQSKKYVSWGPRHDGRNVPNKGKIAINQNYVRYQPWVSDEHPKGSSGGRRKLEIASADKHSSEVQVNKNALKHMEIFVCFFYHCKHREQKTGLVNKAHSRTDMKALWWAWVSLSGGICQIYWSTSCLSSKKNKKKLNVHHTVSLFKGETHCYFVKSSQQMLLVNIE